MSKKKTHDEYVVEVSRINSNVEVIGQYNGSKIKILHRCKIDGHEWLSKPDHILDGHGCPKCANNLPLTQEEYVNRVHAINPNIQVIGLYVTSTTKILHVCTKDGCGHRWMARPGDILRGNGCPKCAGHQKYTHEEYVQKVKDINPEIEIIGQYINVDTPIRHRCLLDSYEWDARPFYILRGNGCPKCAKNARRTTEEYKQLVHERHPHIDVLGDYINANTKILHRCNKDGHEWEATPGHILRDTGCAVCAGKSIGPAPLYVNSIFASNHKAYFSTYLTEEQMKSYMPKSERKLFVDCPQCGHVKKIAICDLLRNGLGCPKCSDGVSYPNKFGRYFIEQLNVQNIVYEYRPQWLTVNGNRCSYDIYFEYNGFKYVIEMDGGLGHGNFTYKRSDGNDVDGLKRDLAKDQLARANNIAVIRIDCKKSELNYIKNNIMQSSLPDLLNFTELDIDWKMCDELSTSSLVLKAGSLWNEGFKIKEIAQQMRMCRKTIVRYLKRCAELGKCAYGL